MTKRKPVVGISLKLYLNSLQKAAEFAEKIDSLVGGISEVEQFLFPGIGTLYPTAMKLKNSHIGLGSQNIAPMANGAFTGEFSIESLIEMGGTYVEIGHSERRAFFHESDDLIFEKVALTLEKNLTPVVCIGESKETTDFKWIKNFLEKQLFLDLKNIEPDKLENIIIAYEPVWAIGAKNAASTDHVAQVHAIIREILADFFGRKTAEKIRIIYGGSVSKDNVESIIDNDNVDGVFVGRFGHKPENYQSIVEIVKKIKT